MCSNFVLKLNRCSIKGQGIVVGGKQSIAASNGLHLLANTKYVQVKMIFIDKVHIGKVFIVERTSP